MSCVCQTGSSLKVSIELPATSRHRRDKTEELLKATISLNKIIIIIIIKIKKFLELSFSRLNFVRTQKRVRISHGKRVIGVRAIEVRLYLNRCVFVMSCAVSVRRWFHTWRYFDIVCSTSLLLLVPRKGWAS